MEIFLYTNHPLRCIICGPNSSGKSVFPTNLILNFIKEYEKIYINSPSFHQDFHQKIFKCFKNFIPINIIPNILNEKDIDIVIEETFNNKDLKNQILKQKLMRV